MEKERIVVAFQGEPGSYSEKATRDYFGNSVATMPCRSFADIFAAIHEERATYGMLPVENSLAGTVVPAYDLLIDHDLRVQGEIIVRIEHCLMASAGTNLQEIKRARSHHQALAQCENNLKRLGIEAIDHYDTAGAARDLARHPEPNTAAIASELAAETYNLEILIRNLEDLDVNFTRFFILGRMDPPRGERSKTSIIFTTRHVPGALYSVMGQLAENGLNLTKIESRPRRNRPWHYLFYVDFEGHEDDSTVRKAMLGILKQSSMLKVLGSYPAAAYPQRVEPPEEIIEPEE